MIDGRFRAARFLRSVPSNGFEGLRMAEDVAIFVSKRFQRMAFAFLCLMTAQLVLASCEPEPVAMGAASVQAQTTLGGG